MTQDKPTSGWSTSLVVVECFLLGVRHPRTFLLRSLIYMTSADAAQYVDCTFYADFVLPYFSAFTVLPEAKV